MAREPPCHVNRVQALVVPPVVAPECVSHSRRGDVYMAAVARSNIVVNCVPNQGMEQSTAEIQVSRGQKPTLQHRKEERAVPCQSQCSPPKGLVLTKAPTPINVHVLLQWLQHYPKVKDRILLMAGFTEGFKLGYRGPRMPRDADCLMSAKKNVEATWKKLEKEIALGRIIGPYKSRPLSNLQCSPIGLIPKQQPGEWRLITHLSFPSGNCINDGIPAEIATVKYATFDSAVELVQQVGSGAFLAKCDIKSAFRLLPIYPGDFDLLGFNLSSCFS